VAQPYGSSRVRKIIPSFISRALHGESIEIYGAGDQVMDMIYITDAARCLVAALGHVTTSSCRGDLFFAGTGRRTDVRQIADAVKFEVEDQTGIKAPIVHLPMRAGETPGSEVRADPDQVRLLGLDPRGFTELEDGLMSTVTYYRKLFGR
ncbi:MAG TPA: NAD-dependent epimerase/dehydratase family protein, partial [Puia sp.]|nr:NAD-dependent epimerase/dehydratase family protein [Puia sp.]